MMRLLTIDEEIILNQFSQEIYTLDEMNFWFEKYDLTNKRDIIKNLFNMVVQAHPTYDEIESSTMSLRKEKTTSAIILLNKNKPFNKFGYKICDLPEKELLNGFDILLSTLSKADNRRKNEEDPKNCRHWWHKDLSDDNYLKVIRQLKNFN